MIHDIVKGVKLRGGGWISMSHMIPDFGIRLLKMVLVGKIANHRELEIAHNSIGSFFSENFYRDSCRK